MVKVKGVPLPPSTKGAPSVPAKPKLKQAVPHVPAHVHAQVERLRKDFEKRGQTMASRNRLAIDRREEMARQASASAHDSVEHLRAPSSSYFSAHYPNGLPGNWLGTAKR